MLMSIEHKLAKTPVLAARAAEDSVPMIPGVSPLGMTFGTAR